MAEISRDWMRSASHKGRGREEEREGGREEEREE